MAQLWRGGNAEVTDGLAAFFRTSRQSGLAFPTSITPFDCDIPEHAGRESCVRQAAMFGNGHRLRRLQMSAGVNPATNSCPHDTFMAREVEIQGACGLSGSIGTDTSTFALVVCPSRDCSEMLPALLEDCAASIDHVSALQQEYYTALEQSTLFATCLEQEQAAAEFAEVEVEFRAPSLAAANELVAAHRLAVEALSKPGGCGGPASGGTCDCRRDCGRRTLQEDDGTLQLQEQLDAATAMIARMAVEHALEIRALRSSCSCDTTAKVEEMVEVEMADGDEEPSAGLALTAPHRRQQQLHADSTITLTTVGGAVAACAVFTVRAAGGLPPWYFLRSGRWKRLPLRVL